YYGHREEKCNPFLIDLCAKFQGPKADNKADVKDKKTETPSSTPAIPRANRVQIATFSVGNAVFEDEILDFSNKTQFASALYPCSANSLTLIEPTATALSTKSSRMRACVDSGCTGNIIKVRPAHALTGTVSNPSGSLNADHLPASQQGEHVPLGNVPVDNGGIPVDSRGITMDYGGTTPRRSMSKTKPPGAPKKMIKEATRIQPDRKAKEPPTRSARQLLAFHEMFLTNWRRSCKVFEIVDERAFVSKFLED
ncbi:hypothetical protein HDU67_005454, partial [Dinochytrium kinnereticum]